MLHISVKLRQSEIRNSIRWYQQQQQRASWNFSVQLHTSTLVGAHCTPPQPVFTQPVVRLPNWLHTVLCTVLTTSRGWGTRLLVSDYSASSPVSQNYNFCCVAGASCWACSFLGKLKVQYDLTPSDSVRPCDCEDVRSDCLNHLQLRAIAHRRLLTLFVIVLKIFIPSFTANSNVNQSFIRICIDCVKCWIIGDTVKFVTVGGIS